MNDILDLGGRVVLVTGAGQGVGRQIALHLAAHNSGGVVVNDFQLDRAQAVAAEIEAAGGKALAVQADVTSLDEVKAMVERAAGLFGPIGVLVNNAGNSGAGPVDRAEARKPFWEVDRAAWDRHIQVNFYGVLNCVSAVVPGMIERNAPARIITIISEAARYGDVGLEVYSGAKAGAAGFMRAVARALGKYQVTANNISIGATNTPAVAYAMQDPETVKKITSRYIVRRVGEPEDVANMALFLASDASSWITGQTYGVNGGFTVS